MWIVKATDTFGVTEIEDEASGDALWAPRARKGEGFEWFVDGDCALNRTYDREDLRSLRNLIDHLLEADWLRNGPGSI